MPRQPLTKTIFRPEYHGKLIRGGPTSRVMGAGLKISKILQIITFKKGLTISFTSGIMLSGECMNHLETYLKELTEIRASGAGVKEASYSGPLANLLNEIGKTLKPEVKCIINLQNVGAGLPDGGFFTQDQFQKFADAALLPGQTPARFTWHEVTKVAHYWLEVNAMTKPMMVREDEAPYKRGTPSE